MKVRLVEEGGVTRQDEGEVLCACKTDFQALHAHI